MLNVVWTRLTGKQLHPNLAAKSKRYENIKSKCSQEAILATCVIKFLFHTFSSVDELPLLQSQIFSLVLLGVELIGWFTRANRLNKGVEQYSDIRQMRQTEIFVFWEEPLKHSASEEHLFAWKHGCWLLCNSKHLSVCRDRNQSHWHPTFWGVSVNVCACCLKGVHILSFPPTMMTDQLESLFSL